MVNHHLPIKIAATWGIPHFATTASPDGTLRSMPAGDLSLRPTRKDAAARGGQVPRENPHDPSPGPSGYSLNDWSANHVFSNFSPNTKSLLWWNLHDRSIYIYNDMYIYIYHDIDIQWYNIYIYDTSIQMFCYCLSEWSSVARAHSSGVRIWWWPKRRAKPTSFEALLWMRSLNCRWTRRWLGRGQGVSSLNGGIATAIAIVSIDFNGENGDESW